MDTTNVPNSRVWIYRVTIPLLVISTIFVAVAIFLLIRPYQTIELQNPIIITNQPIKAGTVAIYEVDQCRYTDATAVVTRRLVRKDGANDLYISLGGNTSQAPEGCYKFTPPAVLIPAETPPGKYAIQFKIEFQVNPIRTITLNVESEPFTVTASE